MVWDWRCAVGRCVSCLLCFCTSTWHTVACCCRSACQVLVLMALHAVTVARAGRDSGEEFTRCESLCERARRTCICRLSCSSCSVILPRVVCRCSADCEVNALSICITVRAHIRVYVAPAACSAVGLICLCRTSIPHCNCELGVIRITLTQCCYRDSVALRMARGART